MQSERGRKMKRNAASMKKYRICKNYGICFSCGEPTKHGHVYCDECLKWQNAKVRNRREEHIAKHECSRCGKPLAPDDEHRMCPACRKKERERYYKRKQK